MMLPLVIPGGTIGIEERASDANHATPPVVAPCSNPGQLNSATSAEVMQPIGATMRCGGSDTVHL